MAWPHLCLFVLAICLYLLAWMDKDLGLSLSTSMACIRWSSHLLPLLGKMPSQQGIFSKRSYNWKLKIDYFPLTTKPHLWIPWPRAHLSYIGWIQVRSALALVCSFHYSLHVFSFVPMSFLPFLSCLVLLCVSFVHAYLPRNEGHGLLGLHYFFLFPHGLAHWLDISFCPANSLGFCPPFLFLQT